MQGPVRAFDRDESLSRLGGDEELFQDLVGFFFEDSPGLLDQIRDGVERGDAVQLERSAHALKGLVANFGAQPAMEAAFALELLGKSGQLTEAPDGYVRLQREIEILRQALRPEADSDQAR